MTPPPAANGVFLKPRGVGVSANETVFNGNRTLNSIRQAESQVFGAREQLRNTEQNTLLSALTAYMDVLEDTAILGLDNNNVDVLKEQLRETRDRFTVGEVTRTDVAQAEASLAQGQGTALSAVATLQAAVARYRQFIGDQPTSLAPVKPLVRPIPKTLPEAISISQIEHPAISGSLHGVDAAQLQVKIAEGALYPTIGLSASVSQPIRRKRDPRLSRAVGPDHGPNHDPDLSGRRGICGDPTGQGEPVATGNPDRFLAQPGPPGRGRRLGPQSRLRSAWCAPPARRSPPTKWR